MTLLPRSRLWLLLAIGAILAAWYLRAREPSRGSSGAADVPAADTIPDETEVLEPDDGILEEPLDSDAGIDLERAAPDDPVGPCTGPSCEAPKAEAAREGCRADPDRPGAECDAATPAPVLASAAPIPPCQSCLSETCGAEDLACKGSEACVGLNRCLLKCATDDPECAQGCSRRNAAGIRALQALMDCAKGGCGEACGSDRAPPPHRDVSIAAAPPDPVPPDEPEAPPAQVPCDACLAQSCGAQADACAGNPACVALQSCLQGCGATDTVCPQACQYRFLAGLPAFRDLAACTGPTCRESCDSSPDGGLPGGVAGDPWGAPYGTLLMLRLADLLAADIALRSLQIQNALNRRRRAH